MSARIIPWNKNRSDEQTPCREHETRNSEQNAAIASLRASEACALCERELLHALALADTAGAGHELRFVLEARIARMAWRLGLDDPLSGER